MTIRTLSLAALCLLAAPDLMAQNRTVFRCADAAGRVTYSDEACKGGQALANDDARSEQARKDADQVVKREERLADRLASERRAAAKATPAGGAALIPHSAAQKAQQASPGSADKKSASAKSKPSSKTAAKDKAKKPKSTDASPSAKAKTQS